MDGGGGGGRLRHRAARRPASETIEVGQGHFGACPTLPKAHFSGQRVGLVQRESTAQFALRLTVIPTVPRSRLDSDLGKVALQNSQRAVNVEWR
eukprot:4556652-Prymnesium_polylepis.1